MGVPLEVIFLSRIIVYFLYEPLQLLYEMMFLAQLLEVLLGYACHLAVGSESAVSEYRLLAQDGADLVEVTAHVQYLEQFIGSQILGLRLLIFLLLPLLLGLLFCLFLFNMILVQNALVQFNQVLVEILRHVYEYSHSALSDKIESVRYFSQLEDGVHMMERFLLQVLKSVKAHLLEMLSCVLRAKQLRVPEHVENHLHVPVVVGEHMLLDSLSEVGVVLVVLLEEADLHLSDQHWVCGDQSARSSQV